VNCSPELWTGAPNVRAPSVERARKEKASAPLVRGSMTSTTPGAGSSTETRARLKPWPGNGIVVVLEPQRVAGGGMTQNWTASPGS